MKKYNITYQHITGETRVNTCNELFDFYLRLGELIEDEHVMDSSISFYTEEVKIKEQNQEPGFTSKEDELREWEYRTFKAFKK